MQKILIKLSNYLKVKIRVFEYLLWKRWHKIQIPKVHEYNKNKPVK